jgi:hypothetical protein
VDVEACRAVSDIRAPIAAIISARGCPSIARIYAPCANTIDVQRSIPRELRW